MECGDCAYWLPFDASEIWGICLHVDLPDVDVMHSDDGEGCPQFKERSDGE